MDVKIVKEKCSIDIPLSLFKITLIEIIMSTIVEKAQNKFVCK